MYECLFLLHAKTDTFCIQVILKHKSVPMECKTFLNVSIETTRVKMRAEISFHINILGKGSRNLEDLDDAKNNVMTQKQCQDPNS